LDELVGEEKLINPEHLLAPSRAVEASSVRDRSPERRSPEQKCVANTSKKGNTRMNLALWIVQGLLAVAFIALGGLKLFAHEKFNAYTEKRGSAGVPPGLVTFTGIAELAGGLGIVLPLAFGVAPFLSPWAALGLATMMLLAIGFHLRGHESFPGPVILFLLSGFVAFGRFSRWM
jgi:uncharacterized membrane protein YphA (DoxX/SURF4 family)